MHSDENSLQPKINKQKFKKHHSTLRLRNQPKDSHGVNCKATPATWMLSLLKQSPNHWPTQPSPGSHGERGWVEHQGSNPGAVVYHTNSRSVGGLLSARGTDRGPINTTSQISAERQAVGGGRPRGAHQYCQNHPQRRNSYGHALPLFF